MIMIMMMSSFNISMTILCCFCCCFCCCSYSNNHNSLYIVDAFSIVSSSSISSSSFSVSNININNNNKKKKKKKNQRTITGLLLTTPPPPPLQPPLIYYSTTTIMYAKRKSSSYYDDDNDDSNDNNDNNDDYTKSNNKNRKFNNNKHKRNNRNRINNYYNNAEDDTEEEEEYNGGDTDGAVAVAIAVADDDDDDDDDNRSNFTINGDNDDNNDDDSDDSVVSSDSSVIDAIVDVIDDGVEEILLKLKQAATNTVSANTLFFFTLFTSTKEEFDNDNEEINQNNQNQKPNLSLIHYHINNAISIVSNGLIERNEDSKLVVLALISNEHILLLGKPGTGKSVLGLRLSKLLLESTSGNNKNNNNNNAIFFQRLLTKFTTPEELFGPLSLKALENDIYRRNTQGYLPTANIAFLDEIFKANSSILNTLLTILNERKFDNGVPLNDNADDDDDADDDKEEEDYNNNNNNNVVAVGTIRESCPIRTVVGASNELGNDSDELIALYDRFLIRKEVLPVSDDGIIQLLQLSSSSLQEDVDDDDDDDNNNNMPVELDNIINYLSITASTNVIIDNDSCEILKNLRIYLRDQHDIDISDRRLVKIVRLLKLSAACDKRHKVDPIIDFIGILQHCLWNIPSERIIIKEWLWDNITPLDHGSSVTPNQLRFLLNNLRQEILYIVRKTNGCIEGGNKKDTKALESLRNELDRITMIAQDKMNSLVRHVELIHQLADKDKDKNKNNASNDSNNFALWMDPDDSSTIQQLLLPRAELLLPEIEKVVEDAEILKQTISINNSSSSSSSSNNIIIIPNNIREDIIELIWDLKGSSSSSSSSNNSDGYRDFTSSELEITSKVAQSKYDLDTFRRWKRAVKKKLANKK